MKKEEFQTLYNLEAEHWWFLGRAKVAFDMLDRYINEKDIVILDAGCGTGKNLEYLKNYGKTYGVDLSDEAIKFCKLRNLKRMNNASIEKLPFSDDKFDLITCFDVLYHRNIKDDFTSINEMFRVCKPEGHLLLTTPAGKFLTSKFWQSKHDLSQHTGRRHERRELESLLRNAGFTVKRISYMNAFIMPFAIIIRLLKKHTGEVKSDLEMPSKFVNNILIGIIALESFLIRYFSLPFGLTLVSIAQKPRQSNSDLPPPQ